LKSGDYINRLSLIWQNWGMHQRSFACNLCGSNCSDITNPVWHVSDEH